MSTPPNTGNYQIGRGILKIAEFNGVTPADAAYVDVGNCPSFEVELTEEELEHKSSRAGLREIDKVVVIEAGYNVSFEMDEMAAGNLQKFLKAARSGNTLRANQNTIQEYSLRFLVNNPTGGRERWDFHRCKLAPAGGFGLISDEWQTLSFSGKGLSDSANNPDSDHFTVYMTTTTTTTSTTTTTTSS